MSAMLPRWDAFWYGPGYERCEHCQVFKSQTYGGRLICLQGSCMARTGRPIPPELTALREQAAVEWTGDETPGTGELPVAVAR